MYDYWTELLYKIQEMDNLLTTLRPTEVTTIQTL